MDHATAQPQAMPVATNTGIDNRKIGVWLFLASEVMFFSALIGAYLLVRASAAKPLEIMQGALGLISVNTFLLICSSFTMALSLGMIRRGRQAVFLIAMGLTILLGAAFVTIQFGVEYPRLIAEGLTPAGTPNVFGSLFFLLTGFHGLHVTGGVVWNGLVWLKGARGGFGPASHMGVEAAGLYWHFVDLVWIILFTIIYLL